MTFLQLCRATALKSGLISSANLMSTTIGQVGRQLKIVTAVQDAWNTIQTGRTDWAWMRAAFDGTGLIIGQGLHTPAQMNIVTRFRSFVPDSPDFLPITIYDPAIGVADESPLSQISFPDARMLYDRGVQTNDRPRNYALVSGGIYFGPHPNKAYIVRGLYMKSPQALAADADVPEIPDSFVDVIKWRAIMDLDGQDTAFADRAVAQAEYSRLYRLLVNEQTGPVSIGGSLE